MSAVELADLRCDVCGEPATILFPATSGRERALYCDWEASLEFGDPKKNWPGKAYRLDELSPDRLAELMAKPDYAGRFGNLRGRSDM